MPTYKRTVRRTRRTKSKSGYTIGGSIAHLAKRAYQGVQFLKSIVNAEKKEYQTNAGGSVDNNGLVNALTAIPAGDDNGMRNGISVKAVGLYIKGLVRGSAGYGRVTRIMIVQDKQNTGTNPVPEDIIDAVGTALYPVLSPLDSDKMARWQVLMDRNIITDDATGQIKPFKQYIKLNTHLHYTGTTANDLYTGQIYMMCIGSDVSYPTTVTSTVRTYYFDN